MASNQMVDNNTYNILQAFVSTLEALEAYNKYAKDGNQQLWQQVIQHTEQVGQLLQQQLPQALQSVTSSQGAAASQSNQQQGSMASQSGGYGATQSQPSR